MRFMAIKDQKQAKKARNIGIAWTIFAYLGALMIGWIGLAIFGPAGLSDPEYVMPSVMLKLFPPALAGLLISGAIAAMVSTADSLLILSATELSESILKKNAKDGTGTAPVKALKRQRITTALIAVVALTLSYFSPSKLIFTIVSYVWAGIGCTFSVVVLFSLFWKRYHGRAAIITIISGMIFTIIWISGGFEQHYRVTKSRTEFLVAQNVISNTESQRLISIEGKRFVRLSVFESALKNHTESADDEKKLPVISSAYTEKGVPARLTTFIFSLIAAVLSTWLVKPERTTGGL
jgi:sodium/proline symporter